MPSRAILSGIFLLALAGVPRAQPSRAMAFDHVHLGVPDPATAYAWYLQYLDGRPAEFGTRVAFQDWPGQPPLPVQILFSRTPDVPPSDGGSISRLAFSYQDAEVKARGLRAAGITWGPTDINQTVADVTARGGKVTTAVAGPNTFGHHTAFIEDSNGVAIELVQHNEFLKKP